MKTRRKITQYHEATNYYSIAMNEWSFFVSNFPIPIASVPPLSGLSPKKKENRKYQKEIEIIVLIRAIPHNSHVISTELCNYF